MTAPLSPARERLMEALRGLKQAMLADRMGPLMSGPRSDAAEARVLAAVEEVVAEERRKWEDDDEDSTDHLTRCECCGDPIGEDEEFASDDDREVMVHTYCVSEWERAGNDDD